MVCFSQLLLKAFHFQAENHNIWWNFPSVHPACTWNSASLLLLGAADGKIPSGNLNPGKADRKAPSPFPTSHLQSESFCHRTQLFLWKGCPDGSKSFWDQGQRLLFPLFTWCWCGANKQLLPAVQTNSSRTNPCVRDRWQRRLWWTQPHPFAPWKCVMRMEEAWKLPRISTGNWMLRVKLNSSPKCTGATWSRGDGTYREKGGIKCK